MHRARHLALMCTRWTRNGFHARIGADFRRYKLELTARSSEARSLIRDCEVVHICRSRRELSVCHPFCGRQRCHRLIERASRIRCPLVEPHGLAVVHQATLPGWSQAAASADGFPLPRRCLIVDCRNMTAQLFISMAAEPQRHHNPGKTTGSGRRRTRQG